MRQFKLASSTGLLVVLMLILLPLFLLGYIYLGATRGYPLFVFATRTVLGNIILVVLIALSTHHMLKALAVEERSAGVLEILYQILFVSALTSVIYPIVAVSIGSMLVGGLSLTFLVSTSLSTFIVLPILVGRIPRLVYYVSLFMSVAVVAIALTSPKSVVEYFMSMAESIHHLGDIFRGLGLV